MNLDQIVTDVLAKKRTFPELVKFDLHNARQKHARMYSAHEGLAVIWEEFEEFKQEVFKQKLDPDATIRELASIAAMCQRFAEDCLNAKGER